MWQDNERAMLVWAHGDMEGVASGREAVCQAMMELHLDKVL